MFVLPDLSGSRRTDAPLCTRVLGREACGPSDWTAWWDTAVDTRRRVIDLPRPHGPDVLAWLADWTDGGGVAKAAAWVDPSSQLAPRWDRDPPALYLPWTLQALADYALAGERLLRAAGYPHRMVEPQGDGSRGIPWGWLAAGGLALVAVVAIVARGLR